MCALSINNPFTRYVFIEKTKWRIKKIKFLEKEFNNLKILTKHGDCNKILSEFLPQIAKNERALLFLDPFGMNLDWKTIQKAGEMKNIEIFLNLPLMAMNRACLMKNPDKLTIEKIEKMNRLWGSNEWQNLFYKKVPTLFGETKIKIDINAKESSNLFRKRLETVFSDVSEPLVIRNSKNNPLYCLILASHKPVAKKIINYIFRRFEKLKNLK